jgi:hypothetical protein
MTALVYTLVAIGLIVLMYWFVIAYGQAAIRRTVESRHRDAEIITESGIAPPWWKNRLVVRMGIPGLSKRYALWRIDRLVKYFKHTPLTDSEETRQRVVSSLREVRSQWRNGTWNDIYPYR